MFGSYVRVKRLEQNISLRQFAISLEYDPGYWSKIERGLVKPPNTPEIMKKIADILNCNLAFLKIEADTDRGLIPEFIMNNILIREQLPAFFKGDKTKLKFLIENITKSVKEYPFQNMKYEEICKKYNVQNCHLCENIECSDNLKERKIK
jgi:transcriptional regulator with XRE-family HTH domain